MIKFLRFYNVKMKTWDFPGGPLIKTLSSQCKGHRFDPLIGELKFHTLHSMAKKKKKQIHSNKN